MCTSGAKAHPLRSRSDTVPPGGSFPVGALYTASCPCTPDIQHAQSQRGMVVSHSSVLLRATHWGDKCRMGLELLSLVLITQSQHASCSVTSSERQREGRLDDGAEKVSRWGGCSRAPASQRGRSQGTGSTALPALRPRCRCRPDWCRAPPPPALQPRPRDTSPAGLRAASPSMRADWAGALQDAAATRRPHVTRSTQEACI